MRKSRGIAMLVAVALVFVGCQKPRAAVDTPTTQIASRSPGAHSPKALISRMSTAWRQGNRNALDACYGRSNESESAGADMALSDFDRARAFDQLGQALRRKFGDPVRLNLPAKLDGDLCLQQADELASATIQQQGSAAFAHTRSGIFANSYALRRRNGTWLVDASNLLPLNQMTVAEAQQAIAASQNDITLIRSLVPLAEQARDFAEFERLGESRMERLGGSEPPADAQQGNP